MKNQFSSLANPESINPLITAESVKNYLGEHPDFLDKYIEQNIPSNILEEWISKKLQQTSPTTNGKTKTREKATSFIRIVKGFRLHLIYDHIYRALFL